MDFNLTEEQQMIQQTARDFANEVILPLVEKAETDEQFPMELWGRLGELGFLGIPFPEKYGGIEADKITHCIFVEEMSKVNAGIAASIDAHCDLSLNLVYKHGTEEQKEKYLVPGIEGTKIGCLALTEPGAGSDLGAILTTAKKDGDNYIINGTKLFITNGSIADFCLVAAYTDKSKGSKGGMSMFVVDADAPGFKVSRKLHGKLGHKSSDTAELVFENCIVPASSLLGGEEGKGFTHALAALLGGRISQNVKTIALGRAAIDAAIEYAQTRKAFGQPIGKLQAIQFKITNAVAKLEAARAFAFKVAWMYSQGMKCHAEAAMAKLVAVEAAQYASYEAIQVFGGYGYVDEYPVERIYRDVRLSSITEGTTEVQSLIIAKELGL
ncbi:MAG TPA: acyl-CoA dehydrogenase family protein [Desulfobacteria bacterium]|nr:acyl-CoA dehydrogenase family protein [Desulfobacteria bacterium]